MDESDVLGPVDYLVVEFPADKANFSGEVADELTALVDRDVVRMGRGRMGRRGVLGGPVRRTAAVVGIFR
jgi:hypothetical protein